MRVLITTLVVAAYFATRPKPNPAGSTGSATSVGGGGGGCRPAGAPAACPHSAPETDALTHPPRSLPPLDATHPHPPTPIIHHHYHAVTLCRRSSCRRPTAHPPTPTHPAAAATTTLDFTLLLFFLPSHPLTDHSGYTHLQPSILAPHPPHTPPNPCRPPPRPPRSPPASSTSCTQAYHPGLRRPCRVAFAPETLSTPRTPRQSSTAPAAQRSLAPTLLRRRRPSRRPRRMHTTVS